MAGTKSAPKKRRNPTPPPPAPLGSANPESREFMRARAKAAEARLVELEAKLAAIEERDRTEAAARDEQGGVVSAERMRRVMSQPPEHDRGPTEARLREWLAGDVKGYAAEMQKLAAKEKDYSGLEAELDRVKAKLAEYEQATAVGADAGADEARRLIAKLSGWTPSVEL